MESSERNNKEVVVQYTFADNNGHNIKNMVYSFNKENIRSVISTDITCANYRLGQVKDDKFYVFYAGRVTGEPLRKRLLEHLNEYGNYKNAYFQFLEQKTEEAAYQQECKDYHRFQDIDEENQKYFKNIIHPARPSGSSLRCVVCGE